MLGSAEAADVITFFFRVSNAPPPLNFHGCLLPSPVDRTRGLISQPRLVINRSYTGCNHHKMGATLGTVDGQHRHRQRSLNYRRRVNRQQRIGTVRCLPRRIRCRGRPAV